MVRAHEVGTGLSVSHLYSFSDSTITPQIGALPKAVSIVSPPPFFERPVAPRSLLERHVPSITLTHQQLSMDAIQQSFSASARDGSALAFVLGAGALARSVRLGFALGEGAFAGLANMSARARVMSSALGAFALAGCGDENKPGRQIGPSSYDAGMPDAGIVDAGGDATTTIRPPYAIQRVSVTSTGIQANGDSYSPSISEDGRFVAFVSDATNLIPGDTNNIADVFVKDMQTGHIELISVNPNNNQLSNGISFSPYISGDGRYVVFASNATNLFVFEGANKGSQIYLKDRNTGKLEAISLSLDNYTWGNGGSYSPSISDDGRYVAFGSYASTLTSQDKGGFFVRDRQLNKTTFFSGNGGMINRDGNIIVLEDGVVSNTAACLNLNVDFSNSITLKDVDNNDPSLLVSSSTIDDCQVIGNGESYSAALDSSGRNFAFISTSDNWIISLHHVTGNKGIFWGHNSSGTLLNQAIGINNPYSMNSFSIPNSFSYVNMYNTLVFDTDEGRKELGSYDIYVAKLYYGFTSTITSQNVQRISIGTNGDANGASTQPKVSGDGNYVAYVSEASNLISGDTNNKQDIFVVGLGYFLYPDNP